MNDVNIREDDAASQPWCRARRFQLQDPLMEGTIHGVQSPVS